MSSIIDKEIVLSKYPKAYLFKWKNPALFSGIRNCIYNGFSISKICYGMSEESAWKNAKNKIICQ